MCVSVCVCLATEAAVIDFPLANVPISIMLMSG